MNINIIDNLQLETLDFLKNLAKDIRHQKKFLLIDSTSGSILEPFKKEILEKSGNEIKFKDSQLLNLFLGLALVEEMKLVEQPILEIKKILRKLYFEHLDFSEIELLPAAVLVILVNKFRMRQLLLELIRENNIHEWWNFLLIICSALPYLTIQEDELKNLISISLSKGRNDGAIGVLYSAVEKFSENQPEIAKSLVNNISAKDKDVISVVDRLLIGIALSSREGIVFVNQKISEFKMEDDSTLKSIVAPTVSSLAKVDKISSLEAIKILKELAQDKRSDILYAVIHASGRLFEVKKDLQLEIIEFLKAFLPNTEPNVRYAISMVMEFNMKDLNNNVIKQFHLEVLPYFYQTDEKYNGIILNLDFLVSKWARIDSDVTLDFLRNWIKHHPLGKPINFSDRFLHSINELKRVCPQRLEKEAINWILDGDKSLRITALKVLLAEEFKIKVFHKENVDCLKEEEIVILCNEVTFGYLSAEQETSLILSMLFKSSDNKALANFFKESLNELFLNYGNLVLETIEAYKKSTAVDLKIIDELTNEFRKHMKMRKGIHLIKELLPSRIRTNMFHKLTRKKMNAILLKPGKDPGRHPLLKLCKHIDIIDGGRSFTKVGNNFTQPNPMTEFSQSFFIPRREFVDPEGAHIRRILILEMNKKLREKLRKK